MSTSSLPDREACYERFREARFGDSVFCVECGSEDVIKRGTTSRDAQRYQCKECGNYFNDLTDTLFQSNTVNIEEFVYIIQRKERQSQESLARQLGHDESDITDIIDEIEYGETPDYVRIFRGPLSLDFSLLMAGDMISPLLSDDEVDAQADVFSQWVMKLAYEQ